MIGKFFLQQEPYGIGHALYFIQTENIHGTIAVAQPVEIRCVTKEERDAAGYRTPAMMVFERDDSTLQSLMDALWQAGYRPKDIGTAGHLAATQFHLEDMRKLVFTTRRVRYQSVPCIKGQNLIRYLEERFPETKGHIPLLDWYVQVGKMLVDISEDAQ